MHSIFLNGRKKGIAWKKVKKRKWEVDDKRKIKKKGRGKKGGKKDEKVGKERESEKKKGKGKQGVYISWNRRFIKHKKREHFIWKHVEVIPALY